VSTLRTARDRARAEIQAQILGEARRHLAEQGPSGLSLRAVARDLGLVPSAVYRYFEHRDALLTAMIVEAYDTLGDAAEAALRASRRKPAARWLAVARAIRAWAVEHPHEYGLLYGTPVPGYAAPDATVAPGTRVSLALVQVVADAQADGLLAVVDPPPASAATRRAMRELVERIAPHVAADVAFLTVVAWTQLFGLLSFELFSQTRGLVTDHEAMFDDATLTMARSIGLA
jgi:AcrR family transcriptional regulator